MVLHTNNHTPGQPGADSSSNAPPALHTSGPQFGPDSLSSAPPALLLTSLAFAQQRKQQSTHAEERRVRFSGKIIRYEIPRRQYVDIVGDWRSGNNWCLIAIKRTARLEAFAEEVLLSKVFGALRLAASSHETDAGDPWDGHQTSAKVDLRLLHSSAGCSEHEESVLCRQQSLPGSFAFSRHPAAPELLYSTPDPFEWELAPAAPTRLCAARAAVCA